MIKKEMIKKLLQKAIETFQLCFDNLGNDQRSGGGQM